MRDCRRVGNGKRLKEREKESGAGGARDVKQKGAGSSSSSSSVVVVVLVEGWSRCFVKGDGKCWGPSSSGERLSEGCRSDTLLYIPSTILLPSHRSAFHSRTNPLLLSSRFRHHRRAVIADVCDIVLIMPAANREMLFLFR